MAAMSGQVQGPGTIRARPPTLLQENTKCHGPKGTIRKLQGGHPEWYGGGAQHRLALTNACRKKWLARID